MTKVFYILFFYLVMSFLWVSMYSKSYSDDEDQGIDEKKQKAQVPSSKNLFESITFLDQKIPFKGLRGKCPDVAKKYKLVYTLNFSLKRKDPMEEIYCEGRGRFLQTKPTIPPIFLFVHAPPRVKDETKDSFSVIFIEKKIPTKNYLGDFNNAAMDIIIQCNNHRPICFKAELEVPKFAHDMKLSEPQYTLFPFYYAMPIPEGGLPYNQKIGIETDYSKDLPVSKDIRLKRTFSKRVPKYSNEEKDEPRLLASTQKYKYFFMLTDPADKRVKRMLCSVA